MKLERIRIEFDAEQDRLLMFVLMDGMSEIRLWLTRRCVRRLWSAMLRMAEIKPEVQLLANPEARSAVLHFEREKALRAVKFSRTAPASEHDSPRAQPLGPEPLLVSRIQARRESDGRTLLALLPQEGAGTHLTLSDNLLHGLMKLVQQTATKAEWDLELDLPPVPTFAEEVARERVLN